MLTEQPAEGVKNPLEGLKLGFVMLYHSIPDQIVK